MKIDTESLRFCSLAIGAGLVGLLAGEYFLANLVEEAPFAGMFKGMAILTIVVAKLFILGGFGCLMYAMAISNPKYKKVFVIGFYLCWFLAVCVLLSTLFQGV